MMDAHKLSGGVVIGAASTMDLMRLFLGLLLFISYTCGVDCPTILLCWIFRCPYWRRICFGFGKDIIGCLARCPALYQILNRLLKTCWENKAADCGS